MNIYLHSEDTLQSLSTRMLMKNRQIREIDEFLFFTIYPFNLANPVRWTILQADTQLDTGHVLFLEPILSVHTTRIFKQILRVKAKVIY
jgi:hypothetical protein